MILRKQYKASRSGQCNRGYTQKVFSESCSWFIGDDKGTLLMLKILKIKMLSKDYYNILIYYVTKHLLPHLIGIKSEKSVL